MAMLGGALAKTSLTNLRNGCEFLANTVRDFLPAARICPEETVQFLQSQLGADKEAGRVAALGLLGALARSDGQYHRLGLPGIPFAIWAVCLHTCFCASLADPVMTEKLPQVAEAVQCLCSDLRIWVSWFGKGKDCWGGDAAANMGRAGVTREVLAPVGRAGRVERSCPCAVHGKCTAWC